MMSWLTEPPPWSETAPFILTGAAKGAVNAISLWGLVVDPASGRVNLTSPTPAFLLQFRDVWQGSIATSAGIRAYLELGVGSDIVQLRALFAAPNRAEVFAQLAQEVVAARVNGVNVDSEPAGKGDCVRNKTVSPATICLNFGFRNVLTFSRWCLDSVRETPRT